MTQSRVNSSKTLYSCYRFYCTHVTNFAVFLVTGYNLLPAKKAAPRLLSAAFFVHISLLPLNYISSFFCKLISLCSFLVFIFVEPHKVMDAFVYSC